jgi:probable phosphoglycerate mutase
MNAGQDTTKTTRILLVRHGLNEWVQTGRLAGRRAGVSLNPEGVRQASLLADRLSSWPIAAVYSSPLERARETAAPIAAAGRLTVQTASALTEVNYGDWTGREIKELVETTEWRLLQVRPSAVRFPHGESLREVQHRAVEQVEQLAQLLAGSWVVLVSHADVIKAITSHYLGMHLDHYQRLVVSPASLSILAVTPAGVVLDCFNDTAHLRTGPDIHG